MSVLDCKQYKTHNRVFILLLIIQKVKKQRRSAGFIFALVMDSNKSTISNLDVDALARLIIAQDKYREVTQEINRQPLMIEVLQDTGKKDESGEPIKKTIEFVNGQVERLALLQDRYFRQCRQGAADFGLTVSSRCRLVVPKAKEAPKDNKFSKFAE